MLHVTQITEIYRTIQGECGIYFFILPEIRSLASTASHAPDKITRKKRRHDVSLLGSP